MTQMQRERESKKKKESTLQAVPTAFSLFLYLLSASLAPLRFCSFVNDPLQKARARPL